MTHDDKVQATAVIALLAALLGTLWGLQSGYSAETTVLAAALAYGLALSLTGTMQAPLDAVVITSIKYAVLTGAFALWVLGAGLYAGWQLVRGRTETTGAFA
ncbi:hypothetical protein [Streptomyces sp. NBC_01304]|uniref:hypothetical protein n=1 Tax=Streptomyces sp. NBC_01304 TaxID=2903818 RepID=UPI002E149B90|nr:hypothetical protein OG430_49175 [Streptomyces sp. NBC_01304]